MYEKFEALQEKKQQKIINACMDELTKYGYNNSSTNRIVKKANISKGSLFKYFHSKEKMYFYILDYAVNQVQKEMATNINDLPDDIMQRIYNFAQIELNLYLKKPKIYQLFKKAFIADNSKIHQKVKEKYDFDTENFFNHLFQDIKEENLKHNKHKILKIIKWFHTGFNKEVFSKLNSDTDINNFKKIYLNNLKEYLEILEEII